MSAKANGENQVGTVKFFHEDKGFGFITDDDTKKDIFVHATNLNGVILEEKDKVVFKSRQGKKGIEAFDVNHLED